MLENTPVDSKPATVKERKLDNAEMTAEKKKEEQGDQSSYNRATRCQLIFVCLQSQRNIDRERQTSQLLER